MNYIVDIVLLLVIALSVFFAFRKGFVRMLLELIAYVAAIVISLFLANHFAPKIYDNYFRDGVYRSLQARMGDNKALDIIDQAKLAITSIPEELRGIAEKFGVNVTQVTEKLQGMAHNDGTMLNTIADDVVAPIIIAICKIAITVIVAVILLFIFRLIISAINNIFKLPVLKTVNGVLGGVLGFLTGGLKAFLLACILIVVAGIAGSETLSKAVDASNICDYVTSINFLKIF